MTDWTHGPLLGFDTETTGVVPLGDRIVSAAVVGRARSGTRTNTWLIDPGIEIPLAATEVHGITTERVRAEGRQPAEALDDVARRLVAAMRRRVPVVAFNACFDLTILDAELRRHGLPTLAARLGRAPGPVLDPLVLDRAVDRFRPGKRRLGDLCRHYAVAVDAPLHTAEVDVEATLDVLAAIARAYPAVAGMPLAELHDWQARAHRAWAENFNAWRVRQGLDGPGAGTSWPVAVDREASSEAGPPALGRAG